MKSKLMQAHLSTVILVALMPIKHDGKDYKAGQVLETNEKDAVFLRMGGCVREPTADELEAYKQKAFEVQRPAPMQANDTLTTHEGVQKQQNDTEPEQLATDATPTDEPVTGTPVDVAVDVLADEPEAKDATAVDGHADDSTDKPANPYDGWLKRELNAELDKRGIEHDHGARNDELEALLIEDDAKKVAAGETAQTGK